MRLLLMPFTEPSLTRIRIRLRRHRGDAHTFGQEGLIHRAVHRHADEIVFATSTEKANRNELAVGIQGKALDVSQAGIDVGEILAGIERGVDRAIEIQPHEHVPRHAVEDVECPR